MLKPKKRNTALDALRFLQENLANAENDQIPAGFKTAQQWGDDWSRSRRRADEILREAVKHGLAEVLTLTVRKRKVRYFKLKP